MNFARLGLTAAFVGLIGVLGTANAEKAGKPLKLSLRFQTETKPDSGRFHRLNRSEDWEPGKTAIILCDVWDSHHSLNAVRRLEEFVSRLNELVVECRQRGVTVIHAPSNCMDFYADHPARMRAKNAPAAASLPEEITSWCYRIPEEEQGTYPLDQSDGGEDDDPKELAEWAKKLESMGRNPRRPWIRQHEAIAIDPEKDYVSDRGDEVWNILDSNGIDNVLLAGVHTNMCVLGRPFGLRQLASNGKNVVLVRDMTDTMYNPKRWPYVSHFTGNDLIVSHIEKFVCPTVTSDQILGGASFAFKDDRRPHLVIVSAENEYETEQTLPEFAAQHLDKNFRVSYVFGDEQDESRTKIPGLEILSEADLALISVRRVVMPAPDLEHVRKFVQAGKPVVGIRTSSHAFALRSGEVPNGLDAWPEFDQQVFGGNYSGHHPNTLRSMISIADGADHPISKNVPRKPFPQSHSLYEPSPLEDGTELLFVGKAEGVDPEPVGWTFKRADGGKSFYISMGGRGDFENPAFVQILLNAIHWAADLPPTTASDDRLFRATPFTEKDGFTSGIEGPACDKHGAVYAVNYQSQGTIGKTTPDGQTEVFVTLPEGSVGNGIRFDRKGFFYVADYTGHNVLKVDPESKEVSVLAHNPEMSQPNDLAIDADGTLYASDPNWGERTGRIWRIDRDGTTTLLAADMGTTNGIEVSPDGKTLYVNESVQRNIWAFDLTADKTLANKRLLRKFDDYGFDGMRCDVDGNLYVTRHGKGTVVKLSPRGETLQEIDVLGSKPTNLCFGGPDGRTVYVTEAEHRRLVSFRVDRPGLSYSRWSTP